MQQPDQMYVWPAVHLPWSQPMTTAVHLPWTAALQFPWSQPTAALHFPWSQPTTAVHLPWWLPLSIRLQPAARDLETH